MWLRVEPLPRVPSEGLRSVLSSDLSSGCRKQSLYVRGKWCQFSYNESEYLKSLVTQSRAEDSMCFGHQASISTPEESPGSKIGLPEPPSAVRPRANSQGTWVGLDPLAPGCRRSCFQFLPLACNRGWSGTRGLHLCIVTGCRKPGLGFIFVVFCHVSKLFVSLFSVCVKALGWP